MKEWGDDNLQAVMTLPRNRKCVIAAIGVAAPIYITLSLSPLGCCWPCGSLVICFDDRS